MMKIDGESQKDFGDIGPGPGVVLALVVFAVVQVVQVRAGLPAIFDGALWDPDSYMWLNRARHLSASGAWFDPVYPRLNPPQGFIQHWTRPIDALLLAGAWPLGLVLGFEDGLYWWSVALSPIFLVLSLLALVWTAHPVMPRGWLWLTGLVFICQPGVIAHFMLGRPDHHSLLILLFILSIGFTLRLLLQPDQIRLAALAGFAAAVGLWVSVQILPLVVITIVSLGLYWLFGERALARSLTVYCAVLFAGLLAALLIERGTARFLNSELDTLSIVHLVVFGLSLAFWAAIALAERRDDLLDRISTRLLCAIMGVAVIGVIAWLVQPGFFVSPEAEVDALYRRVHLERIKELQPVFSFPESGAWSWRETVAMPLMWLGIALPGVPCLVYLIRTRRGAERRAWVAVGLVALGFVPLAVFQVRWLSFADAVLVLPYAVFAGAGLAWLARQRLPEALFRLARPIAAAVFCLWIYLPMAVTGSIADMGGDKHERTACPLKPLAAFLSDPEGLGASPKRLLALVDFSPELLYRTPHSLYAIPNHRFQPGFTASYRVMAASDPAAVRRQLRAANAELIVICPESVEESFYTAEDGARTLYQALSEDAAPDFLEPVPLPEGLARFFKVFEVRLER